jgi:hypothetical protein
VRRRLALCLTLVAVAGCGEDDPTLPAESSDPGVIHVHGVGRNPADGALMVATHTGMFRIGRDGGAARRVGDDRQDTMGFTVLGPDHFLGSGHPGSVAEDAPFLGLIESRNAGRSWQPISLRGDVDFHVLEAQGGTVYGFGSDFQTREARFLRSPDGGRSWERLAPPEPLAGLAIDPGDARRLVALGERRGYLSRDGGDTWRPLDLPGGLVTWSPQLGAIAVDFEGVVRRAADPSGQWQEVGRIGGAPAAFDSAGRELLAATHDGRIVSSRDAGASWADVLRI